MSKNDDRLSRASIQETEGRESRAMDDRAIQDPRIVTDAVRLEMFRSSLYQQSLPDLPPVPGFHLCWLTTTNPRDSVQSRLMLGYELLRPEHLPQGLGETYATLKGTSYDGVIGYHEMVAARIPLQLYDLYMQEAHYHAPRREDEKLTAVVDAIKAQARQNGADVIEGDGNEELRKATPLPSFLSKAERSGVS